MYPLKLESFLQWESVRTIQVTVLRKGHTREKFAINSQVGYLGIEFFDGNLVKPEAIKVLKIKD